MINSQHELINDFFMLYSKFEYTLKMSGFHIKNGNAEADWESFSDSINEVFFENPPQKTLEGIEYFKVKPLRNQVANEDTLVWPDTPPESKSKTSQLLLYVCRVRNNLFHGGGNHPDDLIVEIDRSETLIKSCIAILEHALAILYGAREVLDGKPKK